MLRWGLFALLVAALFIAGLKVELWLSPLLKFVNANSELIQGLQSAVQLILWLGAATIASVTWLRHKKKSAIVSADAASLQNKKKAEDHAILNEGDDNINIIGNRNVIKKTYIEQPPTKNQSTTDPLVLRECYLNRLFETTRNLSLTGIDPKAASEAESRLNLDAVYTALLTLTPEAHEPRPQREVLEKESQRLSAIDQLNRHARLVIQGDPGSGKSTFVNFVALCLSGEALGRKEANLALLTTPLPAAEQKRDKKIPQPWNHGALLPVLIILRDFAARGLPPAGHKASAEHLWRFIAAELKSAELPDYASHLRNELLTKGGLLLLDGLDEVPEANQRRAQIKDAVEDFARTFAKCRIAVTSRTYAYQKQDWRLPNFAEAILAPFTKGQIQLFVARWYDHIGNVRGLHADDAAGRAELLKRAILSSDRLLGLAERPLLLTLMASLHAWRGGSLPEKREELYADTVDLLLDSWERQRVVRDTKGNVLVMQPSLAEWLKIDRQKMRDLLNKLAFDAHAAQPELRGTADIPEERLVSGLMLLNQNPEVNNSLLVHYLSQRAGLLIPRGVQVYTFPHRTFQEYLAACYLTDHEYPDKLAELVRKDPNRWREAALLSAAKATRGSASTIWLLAEAFCENDYSEKATSEEVWGAHLAGQALIETTDLKQISDRYRSKLKRVQDWTKHLLRQSDFPATERALAGRTLARLGDDRHEVTTIDQMRFCLVSPGPFWMGSPKEDEMGFDDERDLHLVKHLADPYWISQYPITNAQFDEFVKADGYKEKDFWPEAIAAEVWKAGKVKGGYDDKQRIKPHDYGLPFNLPNHPVVGVTWYEALAFTRWLEKYWKSKLVAELAMPVAELVEAKVAVTLPSEAEWEKAARGGKKIPAGYIIHPLQKLLKTNPQNENLRINDNEKRRYPWHDEPDANRANYSDTGIGATSAVGCFPNGASPYGCEEMSGNVWEWTRSLWENYPYPDDPKQRENRELLAAPNDKARVVRGGAFDYYGGYARCAYRGRSSPNSQDGDLGFRVVVRPLL